MSKCNGFEDDVLKHIFNNDAIANIGDASGLPAAATAGSIYISLHTSDPGEAGSFAGEATYTSYARIPVARTSGAWAVAGDTPTECSNVAAITFDECTGGTNLITHVGICKTLAGTGGDEMLYYSALDSSLNVSNGITPQFNAGVLKIQEA